MASEDVTNQVTLVMSEDEARWLMGAMQNPLVPIEQESQFESETRTSIFTTINEVI